MSLAGNIGAEHAAKDVLATVKEQIAALTERHDVSKVDALAALEAVRAKCEDIAGAAHDGWY